MNRTLPELQSSDRELLNLLQEEFPLTKDPFAVLGRRIGVSEDEALRTTKRLHQTGLVRAISGIFDPAGIGYRSTLAAMHVDYFRQEEAAAVISAHPGVSHNYARDHYYNIWFTLSLPAEQSADDVISALAESAGVVACLNLPALRVFKLRVFFDMSEGGTDEGDVPVNSGISKVRNLYELAADDKRVVKQLCQDLPLVASPFEMLAERSGMGFEDFMARAVRLKESGAMRRLSAVLRHRKAGFVANGMTCWKASPDEIVEAAGKACSRKEISHCYERRTAPDWPYSLFAMIHGRTRDECKAVAESVSRDVGLTGYLQLFSS
ncbi:MAG: AsnC family transcriptional regulator, partial [Dehalococcoidia bacterium]|nr:AsnC family transcriptional regulator [Dehalococcoidia bacterium]